MTNKQMAFLKAMLEESTITKASEKAGITRATAYKYLKDPAFQKELNGRRTESLNDTVRYLQGKLALCNETLVNIIEDPEASAQIKINAINSVYATCKSFTEVIEVMDQLEEIKRLMDNDEIKSEFN